MSRYLFTLLLYTLVIALLGMAAASYVTLVWFWPTLAWFVVVTLAFHYGLYRSAKGTGPAFIRFFMGATAAKIFLHIIVVVAWSLTHRDQAWSFILLYFSFYLLFTIFEVAQAMKIAKK